MSIEEKQTAQSVTTRPSLHNQKTVGDNTSSARGANRTDAKEVKERLRARIGELATYLYPNGKRTGNHWCVGDVTGSPGKSFKICLTGDKAGLWGDFADSQKHSKGLLDLWMQARGVDFVTALHEAAHWLGLPVPAQREKLDKAAIRDGAPKQAGATDLNSSPVQPRALSELLDAVVGFLRKWVVFQYPEQAIVCSLWTVHTWLFKAFDYSPYLWVFAADMRSGKSRLLEVLSLLVRNPELTESGSSAALIRSIDESNPPTFLLDEIDCVYGNKKNDVEADSLRRFLNAGFKRGATFIRCVGQGSNQVPTKFPAFCPKAMAGIGQDLPATVQDRSVPIGLTRQTREERADRFRDREARQATAGVRAELKALSEQSELIENLRQARPELPESLSDRAQDITEPLIAIADHAAGHWPADSRAALVKLYGQEEDASFGVKLLIAIKAAFGKDKDKLTTKQLLDALVDMEDGPWASMFEDALKHDKLQTAASKLARILKNYKRPDGERIKPHPIKLDGQTVRGFCRDDFDSAWKHWLSPSSSVTSVTTVTNEGKTVTLEKKVTLPSVTGPTGVTLNHEGKTQKVTPVTPVTLTPEEGGGEADGRPAGLPSDRRPLNPCGRDCRMCTDGKLHLCDECERAFNATKTVYPGGWLRFRNETEFYELCHGERALPVTCCGLSDSPESAEILAYDPVKVDLSCDSKLTGDCVFYYHPENGSARCDYCQGAEYRAQYFDVENGFPYGDWNATTEERRAEWELEAERKRQASLRWAKSPEGQAWLEQSDLKIAQKLKAKALEQGWTQEKLYTEAAAYGLISKEECTRMTAQIALSA